MRIRMKDGAPLWDSDCLRLRTAEAFLSSPATFHLQCGQTRAPDLHVPALSYTVQPKDQYKRTTDGQPLMSSNGSLIKPFAVALETLMFIAISWRSSEKSTGLRRIRLKLYWLEVSLGSPAQDPGLCSAYAVQESRFFYVYSLGDGVGCRNKQKKSVQQMRKLCYH